MNQPIPAEAPLDDEAREKLRELGLVTLEQVASAAVAVPEHFSDLVGAEAAQRFMLYLAEVLPPPVDDGVARNFSFGARLDEPQAPRPMSDLAIRYRDQLAAQARECRSRGETDKAAELETALERWLQTQGR